MPNVMIPKQYEHKRSLVAIPQKDYEAFLAYRDEVEQVLAAVRRGETDYRAGRTRQIQSLAELTDER